MVEGTAGMNRSSEEVNISEYIDEAIAGQARDGTHSDNARPQKSHLTSKYATTTASTGRSTR